MRKKTKEQRDSAVGEWVNMVIASFHHKAIPPKIIFNKIAHKDNGHTIPTSLCAAILYMPNFSHRLIILRNE